MRWAFGGLLIGGLVLVLAVVVVAQPTPVLVAGRGIVSRLFDQPAATTGQPTRFVVRNGETAAAIIDNLERAGLVRSAWGTRMVARANGIGANLKAGDYELRPTQRPSEILAAIRDGKFGGRLLTIPEGWRAVEIADNLGDLAATRRAEFLEVVARGSFPHDFLAGRPAGVSLEGYLFPQTYRVSADAPMAQLVGEMLDTFGREVTPALRERAGARGLNLHQVVTLASIVEREARIPADRPEIAAVYQLRLKRGMPLQADPTVQYALLPGFPTPVAGGYWKGGLTELDLRADSPYNTYRATGLPPGPICNPGLASIVAVVDAPVTDNLYFVARPDGSHAFARTLAEHNANVARYLGTAGRTPAAGTPVATPGRAEPK